MAWTTNDEDLLILSDDSDVWSEFVLEEQIIDDNKSNSSSNELISFDSDLPSFDISLSDDNKSEKVESLVLDDTQDSWDFMLSFDDNSNTKVDTQVLEESKTDNVTESNDFWFSLGNEAKQEEFITPNLETHWVTESSQDLFSLDSTAEVNISNDNYQLDEDKKSDLFSTEVDTGETTNQTVWTMADILDEAIAKFAKREDIIAESILSKEEHIKSLREQIASLESAVNTDNEEVSRLNTEKQSIVKNRKALEKMKEVPTTTK